MKNSLTLCDELGDVPCHLRVEGDDRARLCPLSDVNENCLRMDRNGRPMDPEPIVIRLPNDGLVLPSTLDERRDDRLEIGRREIIPDVEYGPVVLVVAKRPTEVLTGLIVDESDESLVLFVHTLSLSG